MVLLISGVLLWGFIYLVILPLLVGIGFIYLYGHTLFLW